MKRIFYATLLAGVLSGAPMVSEAGVTKKASDSRMASAENGSNSKVSGHAKKHQTRRGKQAKQNHRQKHRLA
jgi:hypothetical protein